MLHERYRPRSWSDFAGNGKAIATVRRLISRDGFGLDGGAAFWISGPSGIGKTTLANLICSELCADIDVDELDGSACGVDRVREMDRTLRLRAMGGKFRAVIVNEAHAMTSHAVQAWLTLLERLPARTVVVFTTTQEPQANLFGDFDAPMLSRCIPVALTSYGVADAFAARARTIAQQEGLDGVPVVRYARLIKDSKNNLRAAIGAIEAGAMVQGDEG